MRILITGSAGFIGCNISLRCLEEGHDVVGVDWSESNIDLAPKEVKEITICSDYSDDSILGKVENQSFDVVLHQAAVPRVSYSVEHPIETTQENLLKTIMLFKKASGNCKRVVFASSSSVYGNNENLPLSEESYVGALALSPYAMQKRQCEDYARLFYSLYGLESVCLRYFNVFGNHQYGDSPYATAISAWCHNIKNGLPLRSDGTGEQSRDLCYIDNVVEANMLAAKSEDSWRGTPFNIACGDRTSNNEILDAFRQRFNNIQVENAPFRPGDVMHTQANIDKAKKCLGYEPKVRFWEGFERTLNWWGLS